jgi:hypothetical protein
MDEGQLRSLTELLLDELGTDRAHLDVHRSSSARDRIADPPDPPQFVLSGHVAASNRDRRIPRRSRSMTAMSAGRSGLPLSAALLAARRTLS